MPEALKKGDGSGSSRIPFDLRRAAIGRIASWRRAVDRGTLWTHDGLFSTRRPAAPLLPVAPIPAVVPRSVSPLLPGVAPEPAVSTAELTVAGSAKPEPPPPPASFVVPPTPP